MNEHAHHNNCTHHEHTHATYHEAGVMHTDAGTQPTEQHGDRATTIYTCPMHPQIRRPAPGNCPICGMALEREMPAVDEERNPELEDLTRRFWWTLPLSIIGVI